MFSSNSLVKTMEVIAAIQCILTSAQSFGFPDYYNKSPWWENSHAKDNDERDSMQETTLDKFSSEAADRVVLSWHLSGGTWYKNKWNQYQG